MGISQPIIRKIEDNQKALDYFESESLLAEDDKIQETIALFPTVYIHNWENTGDYEVYIGESNNIFERTRQHYDEGIKNDMSFNINRI